MRVGSFHITEEDNLFKITRNDSLFAIKSTLQEGLDLCNLLNRVFDCGYNEGYGNGHKQRSSEDKYWVE